MNPRDWKAIRHKAELVWNDFIAMRKIQEIAAVILLVLIGLTLYAFWQSRPTLAPQSLKGEEELTQERPASSLVDQSPLKTAQLLAQFATTPEQRTLAQQALRLADFEVDLAFDTALREARLHPPSLTPETQEISDRLQKGQRLLKSDQEHAKQLSEAVAKAPDAKKEMLQVDLVQAEADVDLDQDEVDDAKEDLIRAGGDLTDRIEALRKEHEETTHNTPNALPSLAPVAEKVGLYHRIRQWLELRQKERALLQAQEATETAVARLTVQHNALDAQIDAAKETLPELSHHAKKNKTGEVIPQTTAPVKSKEDSAALLTKTQQITSNQRTLSAFDKRIETQKELGAIYAQWVELVAAHRQAVAHRAFLAVLIIFAIALIALFFSSWVDSIVRSFSMDRRQVESLRTVTRVSSQILALFLILLVLFGPPSELGTFLGLAGAGLTVALKDFIVSFLGWFVLMGKNGIRLSDWVEINGVTGEVVQIGPFHTVLLETGNWTDSGHPTGRRVTFTNSFAIEGHYFNFSTTGQWLWDELQVVLPAGHDPYPMVDAIHKKVTEATQQSTEQAEEEWRNASNSREMSNFSAKPAISVKPIAGGIELGIRYITRASERYAIRAKLYQGAIEVLGGTAGPVPKLPPLN
ncbi:MAG: mechanosensitive ion channel domain-containing protein [Candidatus Acidiferrum sp.]